MSGKITVYVRHETWLQAFLNDVTGLAMLLGPALVNELTIKSTVLNFLLGILGVVWIIGWASTKADAQRIRSDNVEEIIKELRRRCVGVPEQSQK